ncbi:hypothetical protein YC2023_106641 [Brassica napus]
MEEANNQSKKWEQEEISNEMNSWELTEEQSFDWRGRPSNPNKHGGTRAALFVLGLQAFEIMGIAAVGNNLITYVINEMHFPLSKAANIVTNFVGTIFIFGLLGGYLSDAFLGSFWTILIFGFVELSGFILLSVQAHLPQLKPPKCNPLIDQSSCEEAKGFKATFFFMALYLVALGSGCVKPNMIAHGADQFSQSHPKQSKRLSSYFNAAYFAFSMGELIALTLLVWVQTHSGMDVGFGVSAAAMTIGLISLLSGTMFLDKACIKVQETNTKESPWTLCTVSQVEQVKTLISLVPIFASTIVFNTILAQLQTFSVQQGSSMNTRLSNSFHIPPASLQAIPYIMLIFLVPLYDSLFVPFARKFTGQNSGITPLTRIGFGLFLSTFSMVSAALLEKKRRDSSVLDGRILSIFWITPQFLIFGISEMFTAVGLIEFFYKQSAKGMESFLMALTYCSYSFGFYFSSVLVSIVNKITSTSVNSKGWLGDNDLNKDRLDLFYWLLAVLSLLNFLSYLFWSRWNIKSSRSNNSTVVGGDNI